MQLKIFRIEFQDSIATGLLQGLNTVSGPLTHMKGCLDLRFVLVLFVPTPYGGFIGSVAAREETLSWQLCFVSSGFTGQPISHWWESPTLSCLPFLGISFYPMYHGALPHHLMLPKERHCCSSQIMAEFGFMA